MRAAVMGTASIPLNWWEATIIVVILHTMGVKKTNHGALQTTQGMDSTKPKGGLISENHTYVPTPSPENLFGR